MKTYDTFFILGFVIMALLLLVLMPFLQIWAVNSLFGTTISYTMSSWFAVIVLNATLKTISFNRTK